MKPKRTAGGSTVLSYEDVKPRRGLPAHVDPEWRGLLQAHLDEHLGADGRVFHEVVSETVSLDLSVHAPTKERPFYTIATMGVSDAGLNVPDIAEDYRHIELLCYLPDGWNVDFRNAGDESWWPGRLLKQLGRFVHEYRTFFAPGHTIPNPDGPYASGSVLETALLVPPFLDPEEFHVLEHAGFGGTDRQEGERARKGKKCRFLAVWPITTAECQFKLERGTGDLLDVLEKAGVSPVIDPWRSCAVTRRKPPAQAGAASDPRVRIKTQGDRAEVWAQIDDDASDDAALTMEQARELQVQIQAVAGTGADAAAKKLAAATAMLTGRRYAECIESLRRIGADHPDRWADCLAGMGAAYFFLGEFDKAIACYSQAIKHGADEEMMRDNIAEAREAKGERRA